MQTITPTARGPHGRLPRYGPKPWLSLGAGRGDDQEDQDPRRNVQPGVRDLHGDQPERDAAPEDVQKEHQPCPQRCLARTHQWMVPASIAFVAPEHSSPVHEGSMPPPGGEGSSIRRSLRTAGTAAGEGRGRRHTAGSGRSESLLVGLVAVLLYCTSSRLFGSDFPATPFQLLRLPLHSVTRPRPETRQSDALASPQAARGREGVAGDKHLANRVACPSCGCHCAETRLP